jgi:hypothetical protein
MQAALDEWATAAMLRAARENGTDPSDTPDAAVTVDRLDAHGVMEDEIYVFRHSQSIPSGDRLLAFARNIAALTLFAESGAVTEEPERTDPEPMQPDSGWLTAQDETLESLIREARALTGIQNHPPPDTG